MIIVNKAECLKCGDVIESKYVHDFKWCKCGALAVDGGKDYLKRSGEPRHCKELSEFDVEIIKIDAAQGEHITDKIKAFDANKERPLKDRLWDKFCNYSLELDGEQPSDYYDGATTMLEWLIGELSLDEN